MEQKLREALDKASFECAVIRIENGVYNFGPSVRAIVELTPDSEVVASHDGPFEPIDDFINSIAQEGKRASSTSAGQGLSTPLVGVLPSPRTSQPQSPPTKGFQGHFAQGSAVQGRSAFRTLSPVDASSGFQRSPPASSTTPERMRVPGRTPTPVGARFCVGVDSRVSPVRNGAQLSARGRWREPDKEH